LSEQLPEEMYLKVKERLKTDMGFPEEMIDMLTPLGVAVFLEFGDLIKNFSNIFNEEKFVDGIDKHFLKLATEENKEIVEVESIGQQLNVLTSMFGSNKEDIISHIQTLLDKSSGDADNDFMDTFNDMIIA
jgi:uncharacterized protein YbaP (TraB family)